MDKLVETNEDYIEELEMRFEESADMWKLTSWQIYGPNGYIVQLSALKNELKAVEREVEQASGDGKERFETKMKLFLRDAKKGSEAFENDVESLWKTLSGLIKSWSLKEPKRSGGEDAASSFFQIFDLILRLLQMLFCSIVKLN